MLLEMIPSIHTVRSQMCLYLHSHVLNWDNMTIHCIHVAAVRTVNC
jgi:hypothetical protein